MIVGACTLRLYLAGCLSLKEKRGRLKPLLARLRREFNVAVAEVALHDVWQSTEIAIVTVANETGRVETQLETIVRWIEQHWPDLAVQAAHIELR